MTKRKEPWDFEDPYYQKAVEMAKELEGISGPNQARALMAVRRKNPKLCATLVRVLKTATLDPPAAEDAEEEKPAHGDP